MFSSVRQASLGIPMLLLSRVLHLGLVVLVLPTRLNRSSCLTNSVSLSWHSDAGCTNCYPLLQLVKA